MILQSKKFRSIAIAVALALLCQVPALSAAVSKPYQLPADRYQELDYRNDRGETLKFRGANRFKLEWIRELDRPGEIAMNRERSRIYVADAGAVVSYDLSGREMWRYPLPDDGIYDLRIGADGTVYVVNSPINLNTMKTPGRLIALSQQGKLRWESQLDNSASNVMSFVYSGNSKGTFVLRTDEGITGFRDGAVAWTNSEIEKLTTEQYGGFTFTDSNLVSMIADRRGMTYIRTTDRLYAIDDRGEIRWSREADQEYVLVQDDRYLLAVAKPGAWQLVEAATGKTLPAKLIQYAWLRDTAVPIDGQGGLYVSNFNQSRSNGISKIDRRGNVLWSYRIRFSGYGNAFNLISDPAGNVIFTDSGGTLYALDANGNERFMMVVRDKYGPSWTEAVTDAKGNVYAIFSKVGLIKIAKIG